MQGGLLAVQGGQVRMQRREYLLPLRQHRSRGRIDTGIPRAGRGIGERIQPLNESLSEVLGSDRSGLLLCCPWHCWHCAKAPFFLDYYLQVAATPRRVYLQAAARIRI